MVYKSISGVRSIVSRLNPGDLQRLGRLVWCPTQFQEYISGTDYRYASGQGETIDILPCALPDDCADRCRALAAALELPVAGIDLRRTTADEWYCFEVNPSPGFTFFQRTTHQPIDEAIARLLAMADWRRGRGLRRRRPGDPRHWQEPAGRPSTREQLAAAHRHTAQPVQPAARLPPPLPPNGPLPSGPSCSTRLRGEKLPSSA